MRYAPVMIRPDEYAELAQVYDDWQFLYPQPFCLAMRPRVLAAVEQFSTCGETYADLGCGTGLFAAWWKDRFPAWRVWGIDRSPAMIEQARRAATRGAQKQALMRWGLTRATQAMSFDEMMIAARALQQAGDGSAAAEEAAPGPSPSGVEFLIEDLTEIRLPEPLGLATCLFDGLNHILRAPDLARAFQRVQQALAPGGLFIFDLVHEDVFAEAFSGAVVKTGGGLVVTADSIHFTRGPAQFGKTSFIAFREEEGIWRRYDAEISERCWTCAEIREALETAGLSLLRQDDIDPAVEREFHLPRTFWVARRPRT